MTATKDAATVERETFAQTWGLSAENQSQPLREASRGESDKQRENMRKLLDLKRRLSLSGVRPAYILNMNPYQLHVNSVLLDHVKVPPCPLGQPYIVHALTEALFAWRDDKDGDETPVEFLPVMLIRDFEQAYWKSGGVVVFEASGNPRKPLSAEQEIAENPDLQEKIVAARERLFEYASSRYIAVTAALRTTGSSPARDVTDTDRALTGFLLKNKRITESPTWLAPTKKEQDLVEPCPRCKVEPKTGATMCPSCGFILDPAGAFKLGDISLDDEVGRRALQRLSRVKLRELNISQLIEENLDERDARLAEAARA